MPKRHRPGRSATSLLSYIEEIVASSSGQDAFELVFALAAARVVTRASRSPSSVRATAAPELRELVARARRVHPELEVTLPADADDALLGRVDGLLARALPRSFARASSEDGGLGALDAVFEALIPHVAKADKGQFFTPRHVVDFVVRALAVRARELVVDPACGSGAFLAHARAHAAVRTFGTDVDRRAVRLARLAALAQGRDAATIQRADALASSSREALAPAWGRAHVVATNPPFAGRADAGDFEVAKLVRTPERDVLFVERAMDLLAPGGRLGIVLPYNKANGAAFVGLRRWLVARARLFAVIGLPRETFLPHTAQRTIVLFAKKREPGAVAERGERILFASSTRAGKDAGGEPIHVPGTTELDHDLEEVTRTLAPFLAQEGFAA